MKGLKAWEALKALEEGKELEVCFGSTDIEDDWCLVDKRIYNHDLVYSIYKGGIYRIKPEEVNTIEMMGLRINDECWDFDNYCNEEVLSTYKITFKEDKDGNPICESIRMFKL